MAVAAGRGFGITASNGFAMITLQIDFCFNRVALPAANLPRRGLMRGFGDVAVAAGTEMRPMNRIVKFLDINEVRLARIAVAHQTGFIIHLRVGDLGANGRLSQDAGRQEYLKGNGAESQEQEHPSR